MNLCDFKYEDIDMVSESIVNFYNNVDDNSRITDFINLYINDNKFFDFVQKNFLIGKLSIDYLVRLFNDFDDDSIIDDYDEIKYVNMTRWI